MAAQLNLSIAIANFKATGGEVALDLINETKDTRLAFKVKSSNNVQYKVRPVFGFVAASQRAPLIIFRSEGPAKEDKLVIQWAEVPDEEDDPQAPFKADAQSGEVILPLKAE